MNRKRIESSLYQDRSVTVVIYISWGVIDPHSFQISSIFDLVTVEYSPREHEKIEKIWRAEVWGKGKSGPDPYNFDKDKHNRANEIQSLLESNVWSDINWAVYSIVTENFEELVDLETLSLESLSNFIDDFQGFIWWDHTNPEEVAEALESYGDEVVQSILERIEKQIAKLKQRQQSVNEPQIIVKWAQSGQQPGFIYLLKSTSGYWKIGYTNAPANRRKTFNVKLPFEVEYDHLIPTNEMRKAESYLHRRFHNKRVNGEWFNLDDADLEYIKSLTRLDF